MRNMKKLNLRKKMMVLSKRKIAAVIVDEAHRLKGKNNKLGDILRRIDFGCKLLLTGTPLQVGKEFH